jgi:hypothetical protein
MVGTMTESSEIRIRLPADPLLRVLTLYGIAAFVVLLTMPVLIKALALPAWLSSFTFAILLLATPIVALITWLRERRR